MPSQCFVRLCWSVWRGEGGGPWLPLQLSGGISSGSLRPARRGLRVLCACVLVWSIDDLRCAAVITGGLSQYPASTLLATREPGEPVYVHTILLHARSSLGDACARASVRIFGLLVLYHDVAAAGPVVRLSA
jgi:hypothetical protein